MKLLTVHPVIVFASKEEVHEDELIFTHLETGIGRVNSALSLQRYLSSFDFGRIIRNIPLIINVGTCGSSIKLDEGTLVAPSRVINSDFSGDLFEAQSISFNMSILSLLNKEISQFIPDELHIHDFSKDKDAQKASTIYSADVFVNKQNFKADKYNNIIKEAGFFDMEDAALAKVCTNFKVPFMSIKVVSDFADIAFDGWEERANSLRDKLTAAANSYAQLISCYFEDF